MPSSIAIRRAARSDGTFPYPLSSTAAALIPGPYEMVPGCAPGGASAVVTFPQHRHSSDGSSHSVTHRVIFTSQTCAHDEPAAARPGQARPAPRALRRRIRGLPLVRITVPGQARARMPGLPAALAVLAPLPLRVSRSSARPCGALWPRSAPSSSASPSCCCPCPAGVPVRRSAAQAGVPGPAPPTAPPAAPRSRCPSPPPQPAAGPAAHAAPRQADRAHRTQAASLFNLNCNFKHPLRRVAQHGHPASP